MKIYYYELGANKRLNAIVMAGSHDAGITGGDENVQTQDLDIAGQAYAGVRVFDLRIAAERVATEHGQPKQAVLKAFHADPKVMKNTKATREVVDIKETKTITQTKLYGGDFGMGLTKILKQSKTFVEKYTSEFLILKFDKCKNWEIIAEVCLNVLGDTLYKGGGNLNKKRLKYLKGKVIVLFTKSGLDEIPLKYKGEGGILGVRNLSSGGTYDDSYQGLQYFGKGGTSVTNAFNKVAQNEKKQGKLLSRGAAGDPNVMGMMYWTTTGINESIRDRNDRMWNEKNVSKFKKLWGQGLSESIQIRLAGNIDANSYSSGGVLKTFMPNIVMIDFADKHKCKEIYDLNFVAATELTSAVRAG